MSSAGGPPGDGPRLLLDLEPLPLARQVARSRALLEGVRLGVEPETVRLYVARPGIAFGPRDAASRRFAAARRAAERGGVAWAVRLAGGRPVAFHEGMLGLSWTIRDARGGRRVRERFEQAATACCDALRSLGVDARIGLVPGEYCPGDYSVNASGRVKLAGFGQRIVSGAVHLGGLLVVSSEERVRRWLEPVHAALGISWDPATTGSIESALGSRLAMEQVASAVGGALVARCALEEPSDEC